MVNGMGKYSASVHHVCCAKVWRDGLKCQDFLHWTGYSTLPKMWTVNLWVCDCDTLCIRQFLRLILTFSSFQVTKVLGRTGSQGQCTQVSHYFLFSWNCTPLTPLPGPGAGEIRNYTGTRIEQALFWSAHRRISAHFPRISDPSEISTNLLR